MERITTGELAERAGVGKETIRYYERRGLLPEPPRTEAGYRQYSAADVRRLRFIRTAQDLGFTLDEIDGLLGLRVHPDESCRAVEARARAVLDRVERQIGELRGMKTALEELLRACRAAEATEPCPILSAIENEKVGS
ncbi:MAG: MerR family transcriptional regulator [Gemmatimonadetes bacterium]|nr:MerR family transcriptional regulator [Gemmatimonadota bacterium]NIR77943.1 MerR family transcriptional regulator [Gemmatimonadota bacterium]NIT87163.1 MerR family transcriptional regulator [Gemmatimonadota bacterium]NIU30330.1 MerR family transcriptional regulator [Gemmatimonadota bacterium]NIU35221.1 MerR family transcriptional regulator [Gemmatimonadota bacterium]